MDDDPQHATITVSVDDDGLTARLSLRPDPPADALDAERVADAARAQNVDVDDAVLARIAEVIRSFRDDPCDAEHVIAEGAPARDGTDGWIEWMPGFDPTAPGAAGDPENDPEPVDHYNRIRYVRVRDGAHAATIHAPAEGEPGRDVRGRALLPAPVRPCPIRPGKGLRVEDGGRVIAEGDGMLELAGDVLQVSRLLEVGGSVDFSTGNIRFDGSVAIAGGVRDLFEVSTTESIVIDGVVEAARIDAGGNFVCRHGMAGKQQGHLHVGGQAEVGYLDLVDGVIEGDLILQREAVNCQLIVHGRLLGDEATVIGGDSEFGGGIRVGQLGNERGATTTLVVGAAARAVRLRGRLAELEQEQVDLRRQRDLALGARSRRRRAVVEALESNMADRERRVQSVREQIAACEACAAAGAQPPVDDDGLIDVRRALHPGVRLLVGDLELTPLATMPGPFTLRPQENDLPELSVAGIRRPVTTAMQIRLRGASAGPEESERRQAG